ncbi:MAG: toxin-antitoxin system HicB family antitoxin [Myxococcota bacterium]
MQGMLEARYPLAMPSLQVKDMPEKLHARLRRRAAELGRPMREIVLEAVARELDRQDFEAELEQQEPVDLPRPAARYLEEARSERTDDEAA